MKITVDVDEIRSLYRELYGYLLVAPETKDYISSGRMTYDSGIWNRFNGTLKKINAITDNSYKDFVLNPHGNKGNEYLGIDNYRSTLSGIIFKLHSDFFSDEPFPINKTESGQIVINQNITQNQSVSINLFKEKIEKKIEQYEEGSKEKSYLEKLKSYLTTTNNVADIVKYSVSLAKTLGLKYQEILDILS